MQGEYNYRPHLQGEYNYRPHVQGEYNYRPHVPSVQPFLSLRDQIISIQFNSKLK